MKADEVLYAVRPDVGCVPGDSANELVCYVARLPNGPPLVLRGSAVTVWTAASQGGSLEAIVARVAKQVGVTAADIEADVLGFLDELVAWGLLQRGDEDAIQMVLSDR